MVHEEGLTFCQTDPRRRSFTDGFDAILYRADRKYVYNIDYTILIIKTMYKLINMSI